MIIHGYLLFSNISWRIAVYFPDVWKRQPVPAGIPVLKSRNSQVFCVENIHTGRTGARSPSLAQGHLSGTSVSLNPETGRKQRASGFSPQSRLQGPAAFSRLFLAEYTHARPRFRARTGQIHVTDSEKISVWKQIMRNFRRAFPRPDTAYRNSGLPVSAT